MAVFHNTKSRDNNPSPTAGVTFLKNTSSGKTAVGEGLLYFYIIGELSFRPYNQGEEGRGPGGSDSGKT